MLLFCNWVSEVVGDQNLLSVPTHGRYLADLEGDYNYFPYIVYSSLIIVNIPIIPEVNSVNKWFFQNLHASTLLWVVSWLQKTYTTIIK